VTTDTYTLGSYTVQGREEAAGLLARWVRICFVQIHYRRYGGDPVQRGTPHPPSGRPWSAELRTTLREADDDTFQRWWDSASDEEGPIVGNPDAAVPLIKELGLWPEHWDEGPSEDTGATPLSDVLDRVATERRCKIHGDVEWPSEYLGEPCPKCIEEGKLYLCTTHVCDMNGNSLGTVNLTLAPDGTVTLPDIPENYEVLKKMGLDPKNEPEVWGIRYSE